MIIFQHFRQTLTILLLKTHIMSPIVSFHDDKMNHCIINTQQDGTFEIYMYTSSTLFETYFQLLAILTLNFHQVIKIEAHKKRMQFTK